MLAMGDMSRSNVFSVKATPVEREPGVGDDTSQLYERKMVEAEQRMAQQEEELAALRDRLSDLEGSKGPANKTSFSSSAKKAMPNVAMVDNRRISEGGASSYATDVASPLM